MDNYFRPGYLYWAGEKQHPRLLKTCPIDERYGIMTEPGTNRTFARRRWSWWNYENSYTLHGVPVKEYYQLVDATLCIYG